MSRAELARYTDVSPSTVTALVRELIADGLVIDTSMNQGTTENRKGRKGRGLTLNPSAGAVVGVDFGFRHVRVVLCDLGHNILASHEAELDEEHESRNALSVSRQLIDETLSSAGIERSSLIGAGVALPGPIRHEASDRVLTSAILPGWNGMTSETIEKYFEIPVRIDNDANLAALGERTWGAAQGVENCLVVKFHSGIGSGLIVNGALVRSKGGAGEIGHTTIDDRGPLCRCGKRGCLDSFSSVPSILEALRPQHGSVTLRELMALLNNGDAGAIRVVNDAAELVGGVIASACNLFAPQRIVIVGAMTEAGDAILQPIRSTMKKHVAPNSPPEVVFGTLGNRHTALGGIAMALEENDWYAHIA